MNKQINVVSPANGEGAGFTTPLEAKSFARLLAARMREVMSVAENRRAADAWKLNNAHGTETRGGKNG